MTLIRRIVSIVLLALILAGVVYGLMWLRAKKLKILDPTRAMPSGVVMFLETKEFRQLASSLRNHNDIWSEFKDYNTMDGLDRQIRMIDSLGRKYDDFKALTEGKMVFSVIRADSGYSTLFVLSTPMKKATEQVLKLVSSDTEINKHRHGSVMIYHVAFKEGALVSGIAFYESNGLFVISPSLKVAESSVDQLSSGNGLEENYRLTRLKGTAGSDAVANIYVNYDELGGFAETIFKNGTANIISQFAGWSALDLEIRPDYFTLNGFTSAGDSLHEAIRMYHGQNPVGFGFSGILPSGTVYFCMSGFSDAGLFLQNISSYSSYDLRDRKLSYILKNYSENILAGITPILDGEAGSVVVMRSAGQYEKYFIVRLKGRGMGEKIMETWTNLAAKEKGISPETYSSSLEIDSHHKIVVHKSPFSGLPGLLFGRIYVKGEYDYYGYSGNYLVFGKSPETLKSFMYDNMLGKTLENDERFNAIRDHISSRSNLFVYINPSQYYGGISGMLLPKAAKVVNKHKEKWRKIDAVTFQSTSTDDLNYFSFFTHYSSQVKELVNTVWESKLDTITLFKPAVVVNHTNSQKEIFVQDLKHNIYLISNTGNIIWKQKTDGDIQGEVFQVDYFRNGKLQYLFNTKHYIYLIDRNGNPVERYPVALREPASAGLSLFDYDHDGTLRICIPSENNNIYMYDKEGKIIPGWEFEGSDSPVNQPVKHIRLGGKDFVIACDAVRLYILDRRGTARVTPSKDILHSGRNPVFPVGGTRPHIIASDTSGTVWYYYFDGKVSKLFDPHLSRDHYFVPEDINGDGKMEFIFADGPALIVYDEQGKVLFRETYPETISTPPVIYEFSARDKKIGIVVAHSGRIYLLNNDGSLYQGFPLLGVSAFSISSFPGLKDRFNLIVGNNDNFLYNYSVK